MFSYHVIHKVQKSKSLFLLLIIEIVLFLFGGFLIFSGISQLFGIFIIFFCFGPILLLGINEVMSNAIQGTSYTIDDEKIYTEILFANKKLQKIIKFLADIGNSLNIRGTSNIFLKTISYVDFRDVGGKKVAYIEFKRFGWPIKYIRNIYLPEGKEMETFDQIKNLIDRSKFEKN